METKEFEATVPPPLAKKPEDPDVEQVTSTNKKTKPQKDPGRVAAGKRLAERNRKRAREKAGQPEETTTTRRSTRSSKNKRKTRGTSGFQNRAPSIQDKSNGLGDLKKIYLK